MEIKRSVLVGFVTVAVLAVAGPASAADFGSTPAEQRAAGVAMGKEAYL